MFVPNRGQAVAGVAWLAYAPGATVAFSGAEMSLLLPAHGRAVTLRFLGTSGPRSTAGIGRLPGAVNDLRGADPDRWRTNLPRFGGVSLASLYDGVDLRFEADGSALKGTFAVDPGADPSAIRWRYHGVDGLETGPGGDLLLEIGDGTLIETAPVAWQEVDGTRMPVDASYRVHADGTVGFALGPFEQSLPLVIDPYLELASLVGGADEDEGRDIVVDDAGNIYVTGSTRSADFPGSGPPQAGYGGPFDPSNLGDAFVLKLAPDGETVRWMTYLGGSGQEVGDAIALGPDGSVIVAGMTESTDLPTVNPLQAAQGGDDCSSAPCNDLFVARLAPAGDRLLFSTYLGGSRDETDALIDVGTRLNSMGVEVDGAGNIYVVATSDSADFPVVNGFQTQLAGLADLVLVKLAPDGGSILYSSYLGGTGAEYTGDVAVDDAGRAWVVGGTLSTSFPTRGAIDGARSGPSDAVVAGFDTTRAGNASLLASTYLGGGERDQAYGAGLDGDGNILVAGVTGSDDFPVVDAYQAVNASSGEPQPRDAFLTVLAAGGTDLLYSTYFGGLGRDVAYDIAVDAAGLAVIAGPTNSDDLPTRLAYQTFRRQGSDLFVARFDPRRSGDASLVDSTYLGGDDSDIVYGITVDGEGSVYATGATAGVVGDSFPVTATIGPNATSDGVLIAKLRPQHQRWMVVGSRADGANDSIWRTAVGLLNPTSAPVEVTILFHGAAGVASDTIVVAAGSQAIVDDIVGLVGAEGSGAIEVVADGAVIVTSRVYNLVAAGQPCSPGGTLGQGFGSHLSRDTLLSGERAWIPGLAENAAYRTNIALTNTGLAPARATVRLYDGTGRQLASYSVDLAPGAWAQENRPLSRLGGRDDLASGYAQVTVEEGGGILAVGSVVDNVTNDPTTVLMVKENGAGATTTWLLVGSHADGANDSTWRTDLVVLSVPPGDAEVTVRVHAPGGALTTSFDLPSGDQFLLEDVVGRVGVTGSAAIEIVSTRPVVVTSRTFNRVAADDPCTPNGTLGQAFGGVTTEEGLSAGESTWLAQLRENAAFRTNIALTNSGDGDATVLVELFDGDGEEVGRYRVMLAPGEWRQENRPFVRRGGRVDVDSGYARVTVEHGSGILAAGSVVDNVTNDPTTIVPVE